MEKEQEAVTILEIVTPSKVLQPTSPPSLRSGGAASELIRWATQVKEEKCHVTLRFFGV